MVNKPKRIGTKFEREVADYLKAHGHPDCDRNVQHGDKDEGDLIGVSNWCLELKSYRSVSVGLAAAVDEARVARLHRAARHATPFFAGIVKRPRKSTAEAYCVMPLSQAAYIFALLAFKEGIVLHPPGDPPCPAQ